MTTYDNSFQRKETLNPKLEQALLQQQQILIDKQRKQKQYMNDRHSEDIEAIKMELLNIKADKFTVQQIDRLKTIKNLSSVYADIIITKEILQKMEEPSFSLEEYLKQNKNLTKDLKVLKKNEARVDIQIQELQTSSLNNAKSFIEKQQNMDKKFINKAVQTEIIESQLDIYQELIQKQQKITENKKIIHSELEKQISNQQEVLKSQKSKNYQLNKQIITLQQQYEEQQYQLQQEEQKLQQDLEKNQIEIQIMLSNMSASTNNDQDVQVKKPANLLYNKELENIEEEIKYYNDKIQLMEKSYQKLEQELQNLNILAEKKKKEDEDLEKMNLLDLKQIKQSKSALEDIFTQANNMNKLQVKFKQTLVDSNKKIATKQIENIINQEVSKTKNKSIKNQQELIHPQDFDFNFYEVNNLNINQQYTENQQNQLDFNIQNNSYGQNIIQLENQLILNQKNDIDNQPLIYQNDLNQLHNDFTKNNVIKDYKIQTTKNQNNFNFKLKKKNEIQNNNNLISVYQKKDYLQNQKYNNNIDQLQQEQDTKQFNLLKPRKDSTFYEFLNQWKENQIKQLDKIHPDLRKQFIDISKQFFEQMLNSLNINQQNKDNQLQEQNKKNDVTSNKINQNTIQFQKSIENPQNSQLFKNNKLFCESQNNIYQQSCYQKFKSSVQPKTQRNITQGEAFELEKELHRNIRIHSRPVFSQFEIANKFINYP